MATPHPRKSQTRDRKLDIFPENHVPSCYQTYRQHGLIADDEIHLFQQYAQPDEPSFCAILRARGYSIWHAATRTQILKREWHFFRNTLHLKTTSSSIPICNPSLVTHNPIHIAITKAMLDRIYERLTPPQPKHNPCPQNH